LPTASLLEPFTYPEKYGLRLAFSAIRRHGYTVGHMKSPLNRGGLRFFVVAIALAVGTFWCRSTTPLSILSGLPFLIAGVCMHTWAKGCLRQNRVVAVIGPYRFVRHPFYLANALIDIALAIMAGWWPLVIALPVWWLAIYIPVIRGEERFLSEKFPDKYPDYQQRVPCLIPWRRPLPYMGDGFRWANPNIAGGEELPRAARILAYPLLFFVAQGLRADGWDWLRDGWHMTALSAQLALYIVAWQLQRHQRELRRILPSVLEHPLFRAAAAGAILAAVSWLHGPLTSYRKVVPISGVVLFLLSVPIYAGAIPFSPLSSGEGQGVGPVFHLSPIRAILAEMLALLGANCAAELLWLAPPAVALYIAWILDRQLGTTTRNEPGDAAVTAAWWPYLYPLIAAVGAAVIGVNLVGRILPYHF
jgi:protein-S-isoprenylcysteine O-methyltransferase Ste14